MTPTSVSEPDSSAVAFVSAGRHRADPRLPAYLVGGFGALFVAIAVGQPILAALGAPFIALAVLGLADRESSVIDGDVSLETDRVIEGDLVDGVVRVDWEGVAEVRVMLTASRAITPVDPAPVLGWSLSGTGPVELPFRVRASSWGLHDVGAAWAQIRRPGGLKLSERRLRAAPPLQVLPTPLRLGRLLEPAEPRAVAGMHISRFRGHGTDFAELRPYRPGDRLRDLSWATSARLGEPWVTVRHSERTGTVLLVLDAVHGDEPGDTEAMARAARAAWAVASVHLRAQDRVGLLALGRNVAWLPPLGGRRARWQLLEELLAVGAALADSLPRPSRRRRVVVPRDALIVAVTSLQSRGFTDRLIHYRRAGHAVVTLVIETADLLPDATRPVDDAARRIVLARRESLQRGLERGGIPTARVTATEGVGPAISALGRRVRAVRVGRSPMAVR